MVEFKFKDLKIGMVLEIDCAGKYAMVLQSKGGLCLSGEYFWSYLTEECYDTLMNNNRILKIFDLCETSIGASMIGATNRCILWNIENFVDWSSIKVDTLVYVSDNSFKDCILPRYFAKYEDGKVYAWTSGRTSETVKSKDDIVPWLYASLTKRGEE